LQARDRAYDAGIGVEPPTETRGNPPRWGYGAKPLKLKTRCPLSRKNVGFVHTSFVFSTPVWCRTKSLCSTNRQTDGRTDGQAIRVMRPARLDSRIIIIFYSATVLISVALTVRLWLCIYSVQVLHTSRVDWIISRSIYNLRSTGLEFTVPRYPCIIRSTGWI